MLLSSDWSDTVLQVKTRLQNDLNHGVLSNLPMGFPFHHVVDGRGRGRLSFGSYEFDHDVHVDIGPSMYGQPQQAIQRVRFSLSAPTHPDGYYVWRISTLAFSGAYRPSQGYTPNTVDAQVQLSAGLVGSPYFHFIQTNPRTILRSLAISLGHTVKITIRRADQQLVANVAYARGTCPVAVGDIVHMGTNTENQQQLLLVLDSQTMARKYGGV
ncbi:hypothetical protein FA15DRAFT_589156 [Coprinopsis marcescibilis]|uniref:Uncharacterized protein n=1 Tax=Coprinopsis marcescibilis TaxID=230819 RepID=A0A5C3LCI6_COPMA|nr:hypothetical protein FA15DRAFT_589156 [Coprinopsis marcescibilis]